MKPVSLICKAIIGFLLCGFIALARDFSILDVSEMSIDGASTLVITFSSPIAANQDFDKLINVYNETKKSYIDGSWILAPNKLELRLKYLDPKTKYRVFVPATSAIKSVDGQSFSGDYKVDIQTRDLQPMVGFASYSSLLPIDFTDGLPVTTLNVDKINVDFYLIEQDQLTFLFDLLMGKASINIYNYYDDEGFDIRNYAKLVYTGRFDLKPRKNAKETIILPIKNVKALQSEGIYVAVIQEAGKYDNYNVPALIFSITDIGVIAHKNGSHFDILTQSLLNGAVMSEVDIKLIGESGKILSAEKTDKNGYLKLPASAEGKAPLALIAQKNDKTSFVYLQRGALDLGEFPIAGKDEVDKTLFVFGPRDLYRSGETVLFNAILRDGDGAPIADRPIKAEIIQADNKIAKSFTWLGENGFYQYEYALSENAPSGMWQVKFDIGGDTRYYKFNVEDFMPEKMALDITKSDQPISTQEKNAVFNISGKYLYGAPAGGNRLTGDIFLRPNREPFEKLKGFYFGSITDEELTKTLDSVDIELDSEGKAKIAVPNSWKRVKSPVNVILQASLMESGGRPVTRTAVQTVLPSDELPAIKPNFTQQKYYNYYSDKYETEFSVNYDSKAQFEIVFTNKEGERLAKENLQVNLIRERRDYYSYWDSSGWKYSYNQKNIPIETLSVSTQKNKSALISFDVEWGPYVVEVVDLSSGAISSMRFWAGYRRQESGRNGARPEEIKLKIDKPSYKPGDIAKVTVESPESGSGYLFVESNGGLLWWKSITVGKNGGSFEVPVSKEWSQHDIYIGATVIRGGNTALHATPKRTLGLLHLPLYREDRKIEVKLIAPEKIEPNQQVKVVLKANLNKNQQGKKLTAIVSAVDSGILNITDFQTPNPYDAFFAKRRLSVDMFDVYGSLIESDGKYASLKFGGDTALSKAGRKPLTKIDLVALQSKPVTFNEKGEAEVLIDIPDFNGELRFMTQVWSDTDYGGGEQKSIVAAPVVAELGHPRFLAGGDQSVLALDINNLSGVKQELKIAVNVVGQLKNEGEKSFSITAENNQKKVVRIPIAAKRGFGSGDVIIKVSNIKDKDGIASAIERKWTIGVRAPYPATSFAFVKSLGKNEALKQGDFKEGYDDLDEDTVEARISLSANPPLNLANVIKELYAYPYGCVEQTTSGIFPSIYASYEQLKSLGISTSSDSERKENVQKGIARLLGMQKPSGGFGYWSSDSYESHWASVYVTDFLFRAKEQGFYVPQQALDKAIERLQQYMNDSRIDYGYSYDTSYTDFSVKSYAAFVLARAQKVNLGAIRRLYEIAEKEDRSALALMQLGVALKLMGDNSRAKSTFDHSFKLAGSSGYDEYRWYGDYSSRLRDKALSLSLMYEHDLFADRRAQYLFELSELVRTRSYLSTQERNAIYMVGRHFLDTKEAQWSAAIRADNKPQNIESSDKAWTKTFDYDAIRSIKSVTNEGVQTIFASVNIVGYPLKTPKPVSRDITIERTYYTLEGRKVELSELNSGDLIVAVLHITTNIGRIPDALVADLLPAGLELENQNLGVASANIQNGELFQSNGDLAKALANTRLIHQEFRDDRYIAAVDIEKYRSATIVYLARAVTPGSYAVPPPYVESMYTPSILSIGATPERLIVK